MKTIKRLSISIQHHEVTITVVGAVSVERQPGAAGSAGFCRTCNSPWVDIAARVEGDPGAGVERIRGALERVGLHLQVSSADQLQICQGSFQHFKENL